MSSISLTPGPRTRAKRRHTAGSFTPMEEDGSRTRRMEEKDELQKLNKRLEVYILQQRERDAGSGELQVILNAVKEKAADEVRDARRWANEQIDMMKDQRKQMMQQIAELKGENDRLNSEHSLLKKQAENEAALREDAEQKLQDAIRNNSEQELFTLRDKVNDLQSQLDLAEARIKDLEKDLADARAKYMNNKFRLDDAEGRIPDLEEALADEQQMRRDEVKDLEDRLAELNRLNTRNEEQVRKEYKKKLANLINQHQSMQDRKEKEGLAHLKQIFEEKLDGYRDKLDEQGHELATAKDRLAANSRDVQTLQSKLAAAEALRKELEGRIKQLEKELDQARNVPNEALKEKNKAIRQIKAAFERKDKQFDELMDVKIALAMEIKAYRLLLEEEENRLGIDRRHKKRRLSQDIPEDAMTALDAYQPETKQKKRRKRGSPRKKRRLAASPAHRSPTSQQEGEGDPKSSHFISGIDDISRYIKIRNGADDVALGGWVIRSQTNPEDTSLMYQLPQDLVLRHGEQFVLRYGEPQTTDDEVGSLVEWQLEDNWPAEGDVAELVTPEGDPKALVQIVPSTWEDNQAPNGVSDGTDGSDKCSIM